MIFWKKLQREVCLKFYYEWNFMTYNGLLLIIILNIDLIVWIVEDLKNTCIALLDNWLDMFFIRTEI